MKDVLDELAAGGPPPLELELADCARAMGGEILQGPASLRLRAYSIDTRSLSPGDLFFAITGPRTDGHLFLEQAAAGGAGGLVIDRDPAALPGGRLPPGPAVVRVAETTRALQELAAEVRRRLGGLTLIGITGSCGKTTVKDLCGQLLATAAPTLRSPGNLNNLYGLPLTLLRLGPGHRVAVCELGISVPGEMARLVAIARPDVGVVLNVNPVHLEQLRSVEVIAREKAGLVAGLGPEGTAVLNADDSRVAAMRPPPGCRTLTFGLDRSAQVSAQDILPQGLAGTSFTLVLAGEGRTMPLRSPLPGVHNLYNLLAALAAARAAGFDPRELAPAVERLRPTAMRGRVRRLRGGITLFDDSYNSNPRAVAFVLETLGRVEPRGCKAAALGDMLELGEGADRAHRVMGRLAAENGFSLLAAVGRYAAQVVEGAREGGLPATALHAFGEAGAAGDFLAGSLEEGDLLLVKGSRGMGMEAVVERVLQAWPEAQGEDGGSPAPR